jgi:hypothetical protein
MPQTHNWRLCFACRKICFKFKNYFYHESYRVIKQSLYTWWLQYRKIQVMFKVSPASLQTFIDTPNCVLEDRVQYSTVRIPNVFCNGHLQTINCVGIVLRVFCAVIMRCTETFWSPLIISPVLKEEWKETLCIARDSLTQQYTDSVMTRLHVSAVK